MNDQLIAGRLQELSPEYRSYLESEHLSLICSTFAESFALNEQATTVLENGFYFHLLFFLTKEQFAAWCTSECGIEEKETPDLVQAMIIALPEEVRTAYSMTWQAIESAGGTNAELAAAEAMLARLDARPAAPANLPTAPTMPNAPVPAMAPEAPMPQATLYTSTQAAILNSNPNGSNVPPPPRWDSAQ